MDLGVADPNQPNTDLTAIQVCVRVSSRVVVMELLSSWRPTGLMLQLRGPLQQQLTIIEPKIVFPGVRPCASWLRGQRDVLLSACNWAELSCLLCPGAPPE